MMFYNRMNRMKYIMYILHLSIISDLGQLTKFDYFLSFSILGHTIHLASDNALAIGQYNSFDIFTSIWI